jgi:hypothetical protein
MLAILYALGMFVADLFKSRSRLEAENLFLRHQLSLALRQKPPRIRLRGSDRALLVSTYPWRSQPWRAFLRNHAPDIAAMDPFVAPTIGFNLLYGFIVVRLARRRLVWVAVTANSTAEWIARQSSEAFPWNEAPRYLIRDRDRVYGTMVTTPRARYGHP